MSDEKKRAMMAAHLCDMAGIVLRSRGPSAYGLLRAALAVDDESEPMNSYRNGLQCGGLRPEQIDAAVSAIERGENPPGSLPAQLLKMRADAVNEGHAKGHGFAAVIAIDAVFDLLGVKP